MKIISNTHLSPGQKKELDRLMQACRTAEPVTLSIPEDADRYWLAYPPETESADLLACLAVCQVQEDLWECSAFTRPDMRRQGIFSRLLEEASVAADRLEEQNGTEIDLVFLTDENSPDAFAAAEHLGMTCWYSEYRMELDGRCDQTNIAAGLPESFRLTRTVTEEEGEESWLFQAFALPDGAPQPFPAPAEEPEAIGSCRLLPYDASRFYLYHVEIHPELRGRGLGGKLLSAVLQTLPPDCRIFLQVSSDNEPALKLYKKTGFRITETLSYYLY